MRKNATRIVSTLLTAGVVCIAAQAAKAADTLKIGVLAPLTGPGAQWGLGLDGGVRIAADEVNAQGGVTVGGKKFILQVVSYDDAYKAADSVVAINRLIDQDNVHIVFGPIPSTSLLAIKAITEENKVLVFTGAWSAKTFDNTRYVFRTGPTTEEFMPVVLKWLKSTHPEIKRVATLAANDETGWNSQRVQKAAYNAAGYEIVDAEFFERSQTDFRAILSKILAARPDNIELDTAPPGSAGLIVRQARESGFKGQFTKFGGYDVAEIVKAAGAANAEGIVGTLFADPNSPQWVRLRAAYGKFHKGEMGDYVPMYYDVSRLVFSALAKGGSVTDSDALKKAVEANAPFDGIDGKMFWGGRNTYGVNHQLYKPIFLTGIHDGKPILVKKLDAEQGT